MDKYNIKKAFIMPFNDTYMLSNEFTLEAVHRNLLKMMETYKGKLYCFADLDVGREIYMTMSEVEPILVRHTEGASTFR